MASRTADELWPLTAHQPEPVFMEAEKDGALLCLCMSVLEVSTAMLSYTGMLIRWTEKKERWPVLLTAHCFARNQEGNLVYQKSRVSECSLLGHSDSD